MPGEKPTPNAPAMPQGRDTLGSRAAANDVDNASSPVAAGNDPGTDRPSAGSPTGDGRHPQLHHVRDHDPAAKPAEANGSRFGKLPSWALLPRDVAIGLAAIVAAGVIILLVLSWQ